MTYIKYKDFNFKAASLATIEAAESIISEYQGQGITLSLRQLYYQFVSRDLIANTERSYKNLGTLITNARMAGMVSWRAIEDRGRICRRFYFEEDTDTVVEGLEGSIDYDQWKRQEYYFEVWVEKDALTSVIERPCRDLLVPYLACKGYLSSSEAWKSGQRFSAKMAAGKKCVMIHLGDHDPSGMDMTRDNEKRLDIFAGLGVEVRRIALNMDQIEQYSPPPNPAKTTDPRGTGYIEEFGHVSWELDALEPQVMRDLIRSEITPHIDDAVWAEVTGLEEDGNATLAKLSDNWYEVKEFLDTLV